MKKEITIEVPKDWSAITLRKYIEMQKDLKAYEGEDEATLATLFYHLCGITPDILRKLDTETFIKIKNDIFAFIGETELPLIRTFQWKDIEWGFYPNLSQIEYGAYVDICKLNTSGITEDWAKVMAILYRPVTKKKMGLYEVLPYTGEEDWESFMDMGMNLHFGAWFFFTHLSMDLLKGTLNSLTLRKDIPLNIKQTLQRSGEIMSQL